MKIDTIFSSHGCNTSKGCLKLRQRDCQHNISLSAHACGNDVIISDTEKSKELSLLRNHKNVITCLSFIKDYSKGIEESNFIPETYLMSADSVGTFTIWKYKNEEWSVLCTINAHEGSIECIYSTCIFNEETKSYENLLITTGIDQTVKLWKLVNDQCILYTQYKTKGDTYFISITAMLLNYNELCIFLGSVDSQIYVYSLDIYISSSASHDTPSLVLITTIKGHEDWVTCLDTCSMYYANKEYLLVSGSKDNRGRIYKIKEDIEVGNELTEMDSASYIPFKEHKYICIFEVLLLGHTDWISQVAFHPLLHYNNIYIQLPYLLTSSADGTCIVWVPQYIYAYIYDIHTYIQTRNAPPNRHLDIFLPSITLSAHIPGQQGFYGANWGQQLPCSICSDSHGDINTYTRCIYAYAYGGGLYKWCEKKNPRDSLDMETLPSGYTIDKSRSDIQGEGEGKEDQQYKLILSEEDQNQVLLGEFIRCISLGGHTGAVKDICWSRGGNTILSCSEDSSVRVWGQYTFNNREYSSTYGDISQDKNYRDTKDYLYDGIWNEIYRPVIHGYPLTRCLCIDDEEDIQPYIYKENSIPEEEGSVRGSETPLIVTGSEEKKIRLYRSTLVYTDFIRRTIISKYIHRDGVTNYDVLNSSLYWSAYLPELGLTARGITREDKDIFMDKFIKGEIEETSEVGGEEEEGDNTGIGTEGEQREIDVNISYDNVCLLDKYINESRLYRGSLFNETKVLYGLKNLTDLTLINTNDQKYILATTTGKKEEESCIYMWRKSTGALSTTLAAGKMSITALCASSDDEYIVAGGRERCIYIYKKSNIMENGDYSYILLSKWEKAHKRIIWYTSFLPDLVEYQGEKSYIFISADRDGSATFRLIQKDTASILCTLPSMNAAILCLSISSLTTYDNNYGYMCAFGLENAAIIFYFLPSTTLEPQYIYTIPSSSSPSKAINSMHFSPKDPHYLAVASADCGVYLYKWN